MTLTTGDLVEIGLVALLLLWYWRLGRHWSKVPYRPKPPRDRSKDWRWFIVFWLLLWPAAAAAQEAPQIAYVTGNPANADWLGLAMLDGRSAIQLGDGCDDIVEGVNVVVASDADGRTLQLVDPTLGVQVCHVTSELHISDVPCATNAEGVCDYAAS